MKFFLFLTLILSFLIISCGDTGKDPEVIDTTETCIGKICQENSTCSIENEKALCKCDENYHQEGDSCVKNKVFKVHHLFVTGETQVTEENDDGNTQRGIQREYTESTDTITDVNTQLIWLNTENSSAKNWNDAKAYCESLTTSQKQWRLPSFNELFTLVDYKFSPMINPKFSYVTENKYWVLNSTENTAYYISFHDGSSNFAGKTLENYVICVSGDSIWSDSKFTINTDTIKDETTNFTWYNAHAQKRWLEAIAYCEDLEFENYDDWHLPNINELLTLADLQNETAIAFNDYWSSTLSIKDDKIKVFNPIVKLNSSSDTDNSLSVLCVRSDSFGSYEANKWGNIELNSRYTIPKDAIFIDIRTEAERSSGYPENSVGGAIYSSSNTEKFIADVIDIVDNNKAKHIILTCASSHRSIHAVEILANAGFTYVEHILGGTNKWKSYNLPWNE